MCFFLVTTSPNATRRFVPSARCLVVSWKENWAAFWCLHPLEAFCTWSWMHRAWFTADGRSRVDYGLADVWHYRASNNSWNRERARRREGEEACRNWSLWKENNFDLLSINKNKKHLWVCAGGLRANNRSTGTWNIYNLWQVFRAPVLLRALLNDSGFTSHTAPTQHVELQECKEKLHVCWKKKK